MRSLKFWVNEWEHSWIMLRYWQKQMLARNNARIQTIVNEYRERCHTAFMQIMRELDR